MSDPETGEVSDPETLTTTMSDPETGDVSDPETLTNIKSDPETGEGTINEDLKTATTRDSETGGVTANKDLKPPTNRGSAASWKLPLLVVSLISVIALVLAISLPVSFKNDDANQAISSDTTLPSLSDAALLGLVDFQKEAPLLCSKVDVLASTIGLGDLNEAKRAYAVSRSSYEQIEVLAYGFESIDCNIDCRPYSFPHGDASPEYVGFHRIESHLFRDSNTSKALPFAVGLQKECLALQTALANLASAGGPNPAITWKGMLGLATEIAAKKVRSPEVLRLGVPQFCSNHSVSRLLDLG
jgi:hypothetical protein